MPSSDSRFAQDLLGRVPVYLCGHLHTLFGLVRPMHALHASGFMELELADWKDHRSVGYLYSLYGTSPHHLHALVLNHSRPSGHILCLHFLPRHFVIDSHHRAFRVLTIDHNLVSATDVVHKQWPIVTITNPKVPPSRTMFHFE